MIILIVRNVNELSTLNLSVLLNHYQTPPALVWTSSLLKLQIMILLYACVLLRSSPRLLLIKDGRMLSELELIEQLFIFLFFVMKVIRVFVFANRHVDSELSWTSRLPLYRNPDLKGRCRVRRRASLKSLVKEIQFYNFIRMRSITFDWRFLDFDMVGKFLFLDLKELTGSSRLNDGDLFLSGCVALGESSVVRLFLLLKHLFNLINHGFVRVLALSFENCLC